MMAAATLTPTLPSVDDLAAHILKKFRGGLAGLARRAGWQSGDLPGVAWLAAADTLAGFDPSRGDLDGRAWAMCRRQACGFLPPSRATPNDEGIAELEQLAGGDDPLEIIVAAQEVDRRLLSLGAGFEQQHTSSERTARRYRARACGAAAVLLAGGDGRQGELF